MRHNLKFEIDNSSLKQFEIQKNKYEGIVPPQNAECLAFSYPRKDYWDMCVYDRWGEKYVYHLNFRECSHPGGGVIEPSDSSYSPLETISDEWSTGFVIIETEEKSDKKRLKYDFNKLCVEDFSMLLPMGTGIYYKRKIVAGKVDNEPTSLHKLFVGYNKGKMVLSNLREEPILLHFKKHKESGRDRGYSEERKIIL